MIISNFIIYNLYKPANRFYHFVSPEIGKCAFSKSSSLTQILIPSSVAFFKSNILNGVDSLDIIPDI